MPAHTIKQRTRFFVAVEGESEQSFIKWLQILSAEVNLHIHLDSVVLGGGGYKTMLQSAVAMHKRRCRTTGKYRDCFLVVDTDRAGQGDWSVDKLRQEAAEHRLTVFAQNPNHEGLLLRMIPGMERQNPDATSTATKLKNHWPTYLKPANANALQRQFSLEALLRASVADSDLAKFLKKIGFIG
jgi:hypothetical protein